MTGAGTDNPDIGSGARECDFNRSDGPSRRLQAVAFECAFRTGRVRDDGDITCVPVTSMGARGQEHDRAHTHPSGSIRNTNQAGNFFRHHVKLRYALADVVSVYVSFTLRSPGSKVPQRLQVKLPPGRRVS